MTNLVAAEVIKNKEPETIIEAFSRRWIIGKDLEYPPKVFLWIMVESLKTLN